MPRRYADRKIEELEELFERGKHEPRIIAELISELNYRSTPRSIRLKDEVVRHKDRSDVERVYEERENYLDTTYTTTSSPRSAFSGGFKGMESSEQERLKSLMRGYASGCSTSVNGTGC